VKANRKVTLYCDTYEALQILYRDGVANNFVHQSRAAHNMPELTHLVCLTSPDFQRKATTTFGLHFNLYKIKENYSNSFLLSNDLAAGRSPILFFSKNSHQAPVDSGFLQNVVMSESFKDLEDYSRVKKQKKQTIRWGPRTDFQLVLPVKFLPLDALIDIEIITDTNDEYEMTPYQVWGDFFKEMVLSESGLKELSQHPVVQQTLAKALQQHPDFAKLMRVWSLLFEAKQTSKCFEDSPVGAPTPKLVQQAGMDAQFSLQWEKTVDSLLTSPDLQSLGLFLDTYIERKLKQAEDKNTDTLQEVTSKIANLEEQLKRLRHVETTLDEYLNQPSSKKWGKKT